MLYQITVRGTLKEDWQDWINGMLTVSKDLSTGNSSIITCAVRDQAELIGIINWLHNMNMVIETICLIPEISDRTRKEER
jgi:hypothetical protein